MEYLRQTNMIFFSRREAKEIYERTQKRRLYKILLENGFSIEELEAEDGQKKNDISDALVTEGLKSKEEVEIFLAIDFAFAYYKDENTKVGFVLKDGPQPRNTVVRDVEELKAVMAERTPTDFAIFSGGLRQFQLKRYMEKLDTQSFFVWLESVLKEYRNGLDQVNLLVLLQNPYSKTPSNVAQENKIDPTEIYKLLGKLHLTCGQILIRYNDSNEYITLAQVYPELNMMRTKLDLPSASWS